MRPGFRLFNRSIFLGILTLLFIHNCGYSQTQTSSSSYRIRHTSTERYFVSRKYIHSRDGGTLIVGKWGRTEDGSDLLIMKLDHRGEVEWAKKSIVGIRLDEYELTEMSDGSIVFVGNSEQNAGPAYSDMLFIKFSCKGEVVWSKTLSMEATINKRYLTPYSIREGRSNDAIISFYSGQLNSKYTVICRVNSSGNIVWSKTFYGTDGETNPLAVALFSNDKVMVFGFNSRYMNTWNFDKSFFSMKLNYEDGAVEETKGYSYSEIRTYHGVIVTHPKIHFYAELLEDGNFALYGLFSNFSSDRTAYYFKVILNKNLTVNDTKAYSLSFDILGNWGKFSVFPNGYINFVSTVYDTKMFYWYTADKQGKKIREKKLSYPGAYLHLQYMSAQNGSNRISYMVSSMETNGVIEVVQSEDADASVSPCFGSDTTFIKEIPWQVSPGSMSWSKISNNEAVVTPISLSTTEIDVSSEYLCEPNQGNGQAPGVNKLRIIGEDTICYSNSAINFTGRISSKFPVRWDIDSAQNGSIILLNDSTVSLSVRRPVDDPLKVKLYAYSGSCEVSQDSILITVFPEYKKFSGSYTSCDLPLTLNVGNWFKSYLWHDGSKLPQMEITIPGKYRVQLETYCGNIISDSIEIKEAEVGLTSTVTICEKDSTVLSGNPGYASYEWIPASNLEKISDHQVRVYPSEDMSYILKHTDERGCAAIDTFKVEVNALNKFSLGRDTVLCQGEKIELRGDDRFSSYHWNSGQVTKNITVTSPGIYSLSAIDMNGCSASDTITIAMEECKNVFYAPNAFTPNQDGKNDLFKPYISGRVEEYELIIYNKWGEIVFKTTEVNQGWSGAFKGQKQKTDTYIWVCKYRFANQEQKLEKGFVTLIL